MKKTLIALAALAASGAVFAQSTATISGSINVGVMNTGAPATSTGVSSLGGGANAVNLEAVEDLGGGLKGGFTSQIRFNAATGDRNSSGTGNALFHAANVFVSGGFGTVRIGKIAEASNCALDPWGCTGGAGIAGGSANGVNGLIAAGTVANSVSYTTPTIAGFSASYQTSISTRANERQVLNLTYANGPLGLQVLRSNNAANVAADGASIPTDAEGSGTSVGGSYDFGVAKVSLFNAKTKAANGSTSAKVNALGISMPMGAYTLLGGYAKDSIKAANADTRFAVGVNYALSKRTTLGADLFKAEAGAGTDTGYTVRVRHTF